MGLYTTKEEEEEKRRKKIKEDCYRNQHIHILFSICSKKPNMKLEPYIYELCSLPITNNNCVHCLSQIRAVFTAYHK